ncbi:unnamed protein product [Plutella xylostella]|uniref:(diamondback moth) hypothetical protein n=1 Tax=Plutella xylostella TaxID=51655 RepID=A0A8S4G1Q5_PLUXY|nr:unnamed protein product [Plutella xylostella]
MRVMQFVLVLMLRNLGRALYYFSGFGSRVCGVLVLPRILTFRTAQCVVTPPPPPPPPRPAAAPPPLLHRVRARRFRFRRMRQRLPATNSPTY